MAGALVERGAIVIDEGPGPRGDGEGGGDTSEPVTSVPFTINHNGAPATAMRQPGRGGPSASGASWTVHSLPFQREVTGSRTAPRCAAALVRSAASTMGSGCGVSSSAFSHAASGARRV